MKYTSLILATLVAAVSLGSTAAPHDNHQQHAKQRFEQADKDKNGQLSLAEFEGMKAQWKTERQTKRAEHLKAKLQKADGNRDGNISLAEAQADLPRMAKRFAQIDQNRDGQLSTAELQQYRQGMKDKHRF